MMASQTAYDRDAESASPSIQNSSFWEDCRWYGDLAMTVLIVPNDPVVTPRDRSNWLCNLTVQMLRPQDGQAQRAADSTRHAKSSQTALTNRAQKAILRSHSKLSVARNTTGYRHATQRAAPIDQMRFKALGCGPHDWRINP